MTRRSGLGRGLDALLPPGDDAEPRRGLRMLSVAELEPNPRQPRRSLDEEKLDELAASIAALGVLQPLLARPRADGRLELIAGERRLRAAERVGVRHVPVVVVDTDERGSLERALVENVQREDLNPIEEAAAYRQLMDDADLTQEALARRLGRSRVTIANALRLLELPVAIQRLLAERRLTAAHGKSLVGLAGNPFQERLAHRVAQEGMSVRATEDLVRRFQALAGAVPGARGERGGRPAEVSEAQRRLADLLGTRVRVDMGKRKGRIVVDFASVEELQRIVGVVTGELPRAVPRTIRLD